MSVRDDEPMPVRCDGCDRWTYEPRACEECIAEREWYLQFCASCAEHPDHEPVSRPVASERT